MILPVIFRARIGDCDGVSVTNLIWGLVKMNYTQEGEQCTKMFSPVHIGSRAVLLVLSRILMACADSLHPRGVVNTAWAFIQANVRDSTVMEALARIRLLFVSGEEERREVCSGLHWNPMPSHS